MSNLYLEGLYEVMNRAGAEHGAKAAEVYYQSYTESQIEVSKAVKAAMLKRCPECRKEIESLTVRDLFGPLGTDPEEQGYRVGRHLNAVSQKPVNRWIKRPLCRLKPYSGIILQTVIVLLYMTTLTGFLVATQVPAEQLSTPQSSTEK